MLAIVWNGTREHDHACPGLSRYAGDSHLMSAIRERDALERKEAGRVPGGQLSLWGGKPNRLTDERRAAILKYVKKGRSVTWIVKRMHCATRTVYQVREGGSE